MVNSNNEQVAIVTGAGSGIGRAIAISLAKDGKNIVIADINEPEAKKTANMVKALGKQSIAAKCDVRSKSDLKNIVKKTINKFGKIDILCNNAGVITYSLSGSCLDISEDDWNYVMDVNAKGVFLGTQIVAKQMIKQGKGGKIINTASMAGKLGSAPLAHYCASKAAVILLTHSFAEELGKYGINVNAVCPGAVNTPMLDWERKFLKEHNIPDFYIDLIKTTPLGRLEEPEDVAKVVTFLASSKANFITGQAINVTGGLLMAH